MTKVIIFTRLCYHNRVVTCIPLAGYGNPDTTSTLRVAES
jgi:hypothetical protein